MSETSKDAENLGGEAALSRPYARAVFELAKAQGDYARWTDSLAMMAAVVSNDSMQSLLANPRLSRADAGELVIRACGDDIGEHAINLLKMLAVWGPCSAPCPPACPGDLNNDCEVGITDFLILLAN